MNIEYVTIKINKQTLQSLIIHYQDYQKDNRGEYIAFFASLKNITITAYFSSKTPDIFKVVFNGENARKEAEKWSSDIEIKVVEEKKSPTKKGFLTYAAQYGSDEVGFGDFFGPVVVVAVYLDEKLFKSLDTLLITDSKKLTDTYILSVAPLLLNKVNYKLNVVSPEKLNELTLQKGYNMNKIKAMLHLNVLSLLKAEVGEPATAYIDKFCSEAKFNEYTRGMVSLSPIIMEEKGESLFPSVALASMLARYFFLMEIAKLEAKFKVKIPLGASLKVDQFATEFKNKYGKSALDKIVKQNFSNYQKLVD